MPALLDVVGISGTRLVDTVSVEGIHKTVAIWEYDKRPCNGAQGIGGKGGFFLLAAHVHAQGQPPAACALALLSPATLPLPRV